MTVAQQIKEYLRRCFIIALFVILFVVGEETKAASRSAILYVRNEDSISIEQRNRLDSFKGVCGGFCSR